MLLHFETSAAQRRMGSKINAEFEISHFLSEKKTFSRTYGIHLVCGRVIPAKSSSEIEKAFDTRQAA